ncbi:tetratricopeptide repeat protein [uncultured Algibacter sp.]|uniref:tetratricopeptide repeat protein n=1 Tax=uncultured Algibacter sp. TaxID=298659 RepID=UPI00262E5569|nr:tetratricopeptide repeat protein [uncultured Algibacter sp.]
MKGLITFLILCVSLFSFSQEEDKQQALAMKKANNHVYEGNNLIEDDFISAEMEYRKAISEQSTSVAGAYNLANAYIKNGSPVEALFRLEQAAKASGSKSEKHKAFHNIGNVLMQSEKCKEAVEAYKSALRNDPTDDETRYNLSVAKACAEEQKQQDDQNQDQDQDDENKDDKDQKEDQENKDKEGDNKDDQEDKGDEEEKEGEDEKDEEGKPEDDKKDDGKGNEEKKEQPQKPQPQPGQLSPQQIKNLLEAMNNQEQKVQEKMNAEKQKGVRIKTEKDW